MESRLTQKLDTLSRRLDAIERNAAAVTSLKRNGSNADLNEDGRDDAIQDEQFEGDLTKKQS